MWLGVFAMYATSCSEPRDHTGGNVSNRSPTSAIDRAAGQSIIGTEPELFRCSDVAPTDEIAALLGGKVASVETHSEPPPGVPRPCTYVRTVEQTTEPWSFDIDCRATALDTARSLMRQYQASSDRSASAAQTRQTKQPDNRDSASVTTRAVEVGRVALDHHGQSLLFVDDDAPCYVRVNGPSAEGRLGLARMIARKLTPKSAPTGRMYRK